MFNQKDNTLLENQSLYGRLRINYNRNKTQDQTKELDQLATQFNYQDCSHEYWNPEEYSLLYGTPLWEQSTPTQKIILNHLYWVAYYSQIISAEIATILFNQTSAAGLYSLEDFRLVCDMLDLESTQERAHIAAFKTISEQVESSLFNERIFTYAMRGPYRETMIYANTNQLKTWWKKLQLQTFGILSSGNAFLACQYFTVRGLRTLNGKLIQHKLSLYYQKHPHQDRAPIPSKISYYHFLDESYHFNSSTLIGHEVVKCLKPPTKFEKWVANLGLTGCQQDHYHFSVAINGIFWYDPALYSAIYKILRSPIFSLDDLEAKDMIKKCFTQESEGLHRSYQTHRQAIESYKVYLDKIDYINQTNRELSIMTSNSISKYLQLQERAFLTNF